MKLILSFLIIAISIIGCKNGKDQQETDPKKEDAVSGATKIVNKLYYKKEKHLKNVKQLTFGGDNAEAYWNFDGEKIVFQSNTKSWGLDCDQIFTMSANDILKDGKMARMISTGKGRTTCSYFYQAIQP